MGAWRRKVLYIYERVSSLFVETCCARLNSTPIRVWKSGRGPASMSMPIEKDSIARQYCRYICELLHKQSELRETGRYHSSRLHRWPGSIIYAILCIRQAGVPSLFSHVWQVTDLVLALVLRAYTAPNTMLKTISFVYLWRKLLLVVDQNINTIIPNMVALSRVHGLTDRHARLETKHDNIDYFVSELFLPEVVPTAAAKMVARIAKARMVIKCWVSVCSVKYEG